TLLHSVRLTWIAHALTDSTDAALLRRFVHQRDAAAGRAIRIVSGYDRRAGVQSCWARLLEGPSMQGHAACFAGLLLIGAGTLGAGAFGAEPAWRYVATARADAAVRPLFRYVPLSGVKPDELREEVAYRGKQQYARVRYGSDDSRRVAVVVDEL